MKGSVYFFEAKAINQVKIGFTRRSITERLVEVQTHCPHELEAIAWVDAFKGDEKTLHVRFDKLRRLGEWFEIDVALAAYIAAVKAAGPEGGFV